MQTLKETHGRQLNANIDPDHVLYCCSSTLNTHTYTRTKQFLSPMLSGHQSGHDGVMWRGSVEPSGLRDWSATFIFQGLTETLNLHRCPGKMREQARKKERERWKRQVGVQRETKMNYILKSYSFAGDYAFSSQLVLYSSLALIMNFAFSTESWIHNLIKEEWKVELGMGKYINLWANIALVLFKQMHKYIGMAETLRRDNYKWRNSRKRTQRGLDV